MDKNGIFKNQLQRLLDSKLEAMEMQHKHQLEQLIERQKTQLEAIRRQHEVQSSSMFTHGNKSKQGEHRDRS